MKKLILVALLAYQTCSWAQEAQDIPQTKISNKAITAQIYLPDVEKGYYRAGRFDWAGVIPRLDFKGHRYFGQWYIKYDPYINDAIMGPVEAFDPLGYSKEKSKKKEPFTKIGVGLMEPLDTLNYQFSKPYKILDHGKWETKQKKDQIEFTHTLTAGEYPYVYKKTIRLSGDKMILEHTLTNTGSNVINTDVFNHNFFIMDEDSIGPGYMFSFPFKIEGDVAGLGAFAKLEGNTVEIIKPLVKPTDHPRLRTIKGFSTTDPKDYDIRIENRDTGAGVRITCDRPLTSVVTWTAPKSISPEPYINVKAAPGESFTWAITYEFYTIDTKNVKK